MNASEIMSPTVSVDVSDTVYDAAKAMRDSGASLLVAMRGGEVAGVISESDLVLGCVASGHVPQRCPVERHMAAQRQTARPDARLADVSITIIDGELDCPRSGQRRAERSAHLWRRPRCHRPRNGVSDGIGGARRPYTNPLRILCASAPPR